jgi:hypothetical protein
MGFTARLAYQFHSALRALQAPRLIGYVAITFDTRATKLIPSRPQKKPLKFLESLR